MREPQRETGRDAASGLETAVRRLDKAMTLLETRLNRRMTRLEQMEAARAAAGGEDSAGLMAELQASRQRERALESIAAEASAALGRAAEEVRAALAEPASDGAASSLGDGASEATAPPPSAGMGEEDLAPDEAAPEPMPRAAQG